MLRGLYLQQDKCNGILLLITYLIRESPRFFVWPNYCRMMGEAAARRLTFAVKDRIIEKGFMIAIRTG